jgi:hypothetical protein
VKVRILIVAVSAFALLASAAVAKQPQSTGSTGPANGKANKPSLPACHPVQRVSVILKGTLVSVDSTADADGLSVTFNVAARNDHAAAFAIGAPIKVLVNDATKIRRAGKADLSKLLVGPPADRVHVQIRACKADLADQSKVLANPARRVLAHAGKSA